MSIRRFFSFMLFWVSLLRDVLGVVAPWGGVCQMVFAECLSGSVQFFGLTSFEHDGEASFTIQCDIVDIVAPSTSRCNQLAERVHRR